MRFRSSNHRGRRKTNKVYYFWSQIKNIDSKGEVRGHLCEMIWISYRGWKLSNGFSNVKFMGPLEKSCFVGPSRGTTIWSGFIRVQGKELYFSSILHIHYYNFTHKSPLHWTPCNSGLILETILSFVSVSFLRNELPFHIFLIYLIYLKLWTSDFSALSYLWYLLNYFWFK